MVPYEPPILRTKLFSPNLRHTLQLASPALRLREHNYGMCKIN